MFSNHHGDYPSNPIIFGDNICPGTHINRIGANRMERCELDISIILNCSLVAVDNKPQAKKESAALCKANDDETCDFGWNSVCELNKLVKGTHQRNRPSDNITLYDSHGVASQDVALTTKAVKLAIKKALDPLLNLRKSSPRYCLSLLQHELN